MTPTEWDEIVSWIEARWTKGWHAEQAVAFFYDLNDFDASDVWTGLHDYYNQGEAFPPTGSQLKARALDARRQSAIQDRYDTVALPEPVTDNTGWIARLYPGETVTAVEHIRRVHRQRGPCGSRFCDIHQQEDA